MGGLAFCHRGCVAVGVSSRKGLARGLLPVLLTWYGLSALCDALPEDLQVLLGEVCIMQGNI